jgi:PAS domain-containing protein
MSKPTWPNTSGCSTTSAFLFLGSIRLWEDGQNTVCLVMDLLKATNLTSPATNVGHIDDGAIAIDRDRPDADASPEEREWLRITLSAIGDAVITTDPHGNVTLLNPVAQSLTGWTQEEATSKYGASRKKARPSAFTCREKDGVRKRPLGLLLWES